MLMAQPPEVLVIEADRWMPYNGDPASERPGFAIEMARAVFEPKGVRVEYREVPWQRALADARDEVAGAVVGVSKAEGREFVFPEESLGPAATAFFARKGGGWRYRGGPSLLGVKLAGILGYAYEEPLATHVREHAGDRRLLDFSGGDEAFEKNVLKLREGLVDVVPEHPEVFAAKVRAMGMDPEDFEEVGRLERAAPVYLAFSPAHPQAAIWASWWDEGVRAMRRDGSLATLLARYGVKDWGSGKEEKP